MKKTEKLFRDSDGTTWRIDVRAPSASSAMIVFHYPDAGTSRYDRYAWLQSNGPGARDKEGPGHTNNTFTGTDPSIARFACGKDSQICIQMHVHNLTRL